MASPVEASEKKTSVDEAALRNGTNAPSNKVIMTDELATGADRALAEQYGYQPVRPMQQKLMK